MMSVAISKSPGEPLTTMLWLARSWLTLAVVTTWPLGILRVRACVRMEATFVTSAERGRKTLVSRMLCERNGTLPPMLFVPTAPLSMRLIRRSMSSSWPGMGAATIWPWVTVARLM